MYRLGKIAEEPKLTPCPNTSCILTFLEPFCVASDKVHTKAYSVVMNSTQ